MKTSHVKTEDAASTCDFIANVIATHLECLACLEDERRRDALRCFAVEQACNKARQWVLSGGWGGVTQ